MVCKLTLVCVQIFRACEKNSLVQTAAIRGSELECAYCYLPDCVILGAMTKHVIRKSTTNTHASTIVCIKYKITHRLLLKIHYIMQCFVIMKFIINDRSTTLWERISTFST